MIVGPVCDQYTTEEKSANISCWCGRHPEASRDPHGLLHAQRKELGKRSGMTKDHTELIPAPTTRKGRGLLHTDRHSNCDIAMLLDMGVSTAEEKRTAGAEHSLPQE